MPELPEVETIKNELTPVAAGRTITRIEFFWDKTLRGSTQDEIDRLVSGRRITAMSRRGKYLLFNLDNGLVLAVHLKMTGSLLVKSDTDEPQKHTRAIIYLSGGHRLFFNDPRKFGRFQLLKPGDNPLGDLGVEPLSDDFTSHRLGELLSRRRAPIKITLLDQSLIAGIGNMYADEALFLAGIHPLRPADSLSPHEITRLRDAIRRVLRQAIENKGASMVNYVRPGGEVGSAHSHFKVAHRKGKCTACPGDVQRMVVRGRGTYYCPACQH